MGIPSITEFKGISCCENTKISLDEINKIHPDLLDLARNADQIMRSSFYGGGNWEWKGNDRVSDAGFRNGFASLSEIEETITNTKGKLRKDQEAINDPKHFCSISLEDHRNKAKQLQGTLQRYQAAYEALLQHACSCKENS